MADSVQILHNDSVIKRIHGNPSQQQLLASSSGARSRHNRGTYSAVKPSSSIPSKYHTVVIDTADHKGFLSTSKRFNYDLSSHVTPAPNYYVDAAGTSATTIVSDSPSYGKRGTGGFASRSVRRIDGGVGSAGPGPAGYSVASSAVVSRADFNRAAATSSFHPPIAVPRPERAAGSSAPAPNRYNALEALAKLKENRSRDLASVFKSTTLRGGAANLADASRRPGPGTYDITRADALVGEAPRVPVSCFRPSGPRQSGPRPTENPGPGTYEHEPNKLMHSGEQRGGYQFPMQHYLCLSAPALPLPPTPPLPGPGQYELAPRPVSKHYMSSSMFLSNTSRWGGGGGGGAKVAGGLPGPAHYQPELLGKQTFAYNADRHWAV